MPKRKDQELSKARIKKGTNLDLIGRAAKRSRRYYQDEVDKDVTRKIGKKAFREKRQRESLAQEQDKKEKSYNKGMAALVQQAEATEPGSKEEKRIMRSIQRMKAIGY